MQLPLYGLYADDFNLFISLEKLHVSLVYANTDTITVLPFDLLDKRLWGSEKGLRKIHLSASSLPSASWLQTYPTWIFHILFGWTNIVACQNSGTLQPHEYGCVMHDTHNIVDPTTSNHENHL
jgi:hypothetical protein